MGVCQTASDPCAIADDRVLAAPSGKQRSECGRQAAPAAAVGTCRWLAGPAVPTCGARPPALRLRLSACMHLCEAMKQAIERWGCVVTRLVPQPGRRQRMLALLSGPLQAPCLPQRVHIALKCALAGSRCHQLGSDCSAQVACHPADLQASHPLALPGTRQLCIHTLSANPSAGHRVPGALGAFTAGVGQSVNWSVSVLACGRSSCGQSGAAQEGRVQDGDRSSKKPWLEKRSVASSELLNRSFGAAVGCYHAGASVGGRHTACHPTACWYRHAGRFSYSAPARSLLCWHIWAHSMALCTL